MSEINIRQKLFNWKAIEEVTQVKAPSIMSTFRKDIKRFVHIEKSYNVFKTIHSDESYNRSHNNIENAVKYIKIVEGDDVEIFFNIMHIDSLSFEELKKL